MLVNSDLTVYHKVEYNHDYKWKTHYYKNNSTHCLPPTQYLYQGFYLQTIHLIFLDDIL